MSTERIYKVNTRVSIKERNCGIHCLIGIAVSYVYLLVLFSHECHLGIYQSE